MEKIDKIFSVKANGHSMLPILQDGDIIEYIQSSFEKIFINDIVLIYQKNELIAHRVIYKTKSICITRGDNNFIADKPLKKGSILAKVVRFKRHNKWHGLQDLYYVQSNFYLKEIIKIETLLKLYKIPHVFIKGVLVSLRYEKAIPKRIYGDCDVLIQRSEYKKIVNMFSKLGYGLICKPPSSFTSLKKPNELAEVSFSKMVNNVPIIFDVHFEAAFLISQLKGMNFIFPKNKLMKFSSGILERREEIKINNTDYPLCSVSDQILYLALHILNHNFSDSIRYEFLSTVIKRKATKKLFNDLTQTILENELEGYVYPVFLLINKYYKKTIPQNFISSIEPPPFRKWMAKNIIEKVDIFSHDAQELKKVFNLFFLSAEPVWKKILLFFEPETALAVLWVTRKRCRIILQLTRFKLTHTSKEKFHYKKEGI
ncbi:MAG: nucleotidyltransferase family protein [Candidatus Roizmanbacteria bacterium]|nr:nucleotidyltransferase family protein [Candidatus Roizmanbacteria bacterium]